MIWNVSNRVFRFPDSFFSARIIGFKLFLPDQRCCYMIFCSINNIVIIMIVIIFVINAIKLKRRPSLRRCPLASCSLFASVSTATAAAVDSLASVNWLNTRIFVYHFTSFRLIYRMFVMVHLNYYAH